MVTLDQMFYYGLGTLGYLLSPTMVIWGWIRWIRRPKQTSIPSLLSLVGFGLATASALVAIATVSYAQIIHGFAHYDPNLLRIEQIGALVSLGGIAFGICGIFRASSLRWHSPTSALGTLAFWVLMTSLE